MNALEKRGRAMRKSGGFDIAMGVVTILTGVTVGILNIVNGGSLIKKSKEL